VAIIPRNFAFTGLTPEGPNGKKWTAKYGVVGLDMLERDLIADGMNETGLAVGVFYHPGFAAYAEYDPNKATQSIAAVDVASYLLTQCATIEEARQAMRSERVVPVKEAAINGVPPIHWMVVEPSGKAIVIEYTAGELTIHDNPLGVITNAPNFDWHMTNLRNHINLSATALPAKNVEELNSAPLGVGSGMIGLPGDYTPPSRFVRAVAWSQTTRPLPDSGEAIYELFRILDNFNLPLGSAEGSDITDNANDMRSSTIWTTRWDLKKKVLYFHTQHNRRLRMVDASKLDFSGTNIQRVQLDESKEQDVKELKPTASTK
jgi:choloylglycine hydrolase